MHKWFPQSGIAQKNRHPYTQWQTPTQPWVSNSIISPSMGIQQSWSLPHVLPSYLLRTPTIAIILPHCKCLFADLLSLLKKSGSMYSLLYIQPSACLWKHSLDAYFINHLTQIINTGIYIKYVSEKRLLWNSKGQCIKKKKNPTYSCL